VEINLLRLEDYALEKLSENELFCAGVNVGVRLYQSKLVDAHKRKEGLLVDGDLYYLESGKERLERILNEICK